MSNEERYRSYDCYIAGFEDAKNGITEHYETALAEKEEEEKKENRIKQFNKICDEQVYRYEEYWQLLLREAGRVFTLDDFGKGYDWDILEKTLNGYGIEVDARWTGDDYDIMLTWDTDIRLGILKHFTELYGLKSIKFIVETDGEEQGYTRLTEFCDGIHSAVNRAWIKYGYGAKDIFELDINAFERFMYAMSYTNKLCELNLKEINEDEESEDKQQELLDKIHNFWNLEEDDWIKEYNKKHMWAALHGDAEAKATAFWSVDNKN